MMIFGDWWLLSGGFESIAQCVFYMSAWPQQQRRAVRGGGFVPIPTCPVCNSLSVRANSQTTPPGGLGKATEDRRHAIPQLDADADVSVCGSDSTSQPSTPLPPPDDDPPTEKRLCCLCKANKIINIDFKNCPDRLR